MKQINQKREDFWSTRIEGNPEVWNLIKQAIDSNNKDTAKAMIEASELRCA